MTDVQAELVRTCRWRLERWPTDRSIAQIIFTDMLALPTEADFDRAVQRARGAGARAVRTSALFPRSQRIAVSAGFEPIDTLALLRARIGDGIEAAPDNVANATRPATTRLRGTHLTSAVEIDRRSFGHEWANSANSLRQIMRATPRARGRVVRNSPTVRSGFVSRPGIDGFVISGVSGTSGYIQRLAVHPEQRRRGIASALIADSLAWMRRSGATTVFVNTGIDNAAAKSLYSSFGFVDTGEVLTINERVLSEASRR